MLLIACVVMLLFAIGAFPPLGWNNSSLGYYPSGFGLIVVLVLLALIFRGRPL